MEHKSESIKGKVFLAFTMNRNIIEKISSSSTSQNLSVISGYIYTLRSETVLPQVSGSSVSEPTPSSESMADTTIDGSQRQTMLDSNNQRIADLLEAIRVRHGITASSTPNLQQGIDIPAVAAALEGFRSTVKSIFAEHRQALQATDEIADKISVPQSTVEVEIPRSIFIPKPTVDSPIPDSQNVGSEDGFTQPPVTGMIRFCISPLVTRARFQDLSPRMVDDVIGLAFYGCTSNTHLFDPGGTNCVKDCGFYQSWNFIEESLLSVEMVDTGLRNLAGGCSNLRKLVVANTSELVLLTVTEACSRLQNVAEGFLPMEGTFEELNKLPELKLDAKQAQGFLPFFKTLPTDSRAVRFFDRKDYYTAHGENSVFIAKTYYHTTTALRQLGSGSNALSSVSISKNMFETIARDLLLERNDHTVELYEGSGSNWRLVKTGSPGNIGSFEDVLFANNEMQGTPVVVSIFPNFQESRCVIGMAYVDLTRRILGLAEFLDDSRFTFLESSLVALGAKECILPAESGKSSECKSLYDSLETCAVMITERKKQEFKGRDLDSDLKRSVKGNIELATPALGALLSFSELLSDEGNYGNFTINIYDIGGFMRLDSAAMRALNVMESKTVANKNCSLFGLMNRTCTAGMGKRLLHMWLKQPLVDLNEIKTRLDIVQCFVEEAGLRQDLRQHLKRISDVERLVRSLERRRGGLQHIIKLYQSTIRLPFIKTALQQYTGEFSSLISKKYLEKLEALTDEDHLSKFIELVEYSADLDQLENGEYMISSSYDATLASLKDQKELLEQQIHELHKKTAIELDLLVDKALKLDEQPERLIGGTLWDVSHRVWDPGGFPSSRVSLWQLLSSQTLRSRFFKRGRFDIGNLRWRFTKDTWRVEIKDGT